MYNKITIGCHKISSNISVQEYFTISRAKNLNPEIDISVSPAVEACVAEGLTPQTPDLEVRDSSLARHVVSLDKELFYTLSLLTEVYKWLTLRWTSIIPSRGDVAKLLGTLHAKKTGISPFGPLVHLPLYLPTETFEQPRFQGSPFHFPSERPWVRG